MIIGNSSPIYPLWAFMMVATSMILVPRKNYKYLLPHGIFGTVIISVILAVTINLIKAWKYVDIEPFSIFGISVFILVAWGATIIIFLWALPLDLPSYVNWLYIALFSIMGVVLDSIFHNLGLRPYASWYRNWMWFFISYGIFWVNYKAFMFRFKKSQNT